MEYANTTGTADADAAAEAAVPPTAEQIIAWLADHDTALKYRSLGEYRIDALKYARGEL